MNSQDIICKKICMLGTFGVGKTSLVRRFVYNQFDEKYLSTIGVQISHKMIPPNSNTSNAQLKLILWDIANIEKMTGMIENYFRGSHGAIVVCDITRSKTLEEMDVFLNPFKEINPQSKLVFVGNKIDLVEDKPEVVEPISNLAKFYQSPYLLTSAKTSHNVEQVFQTIGDMFETE